MAAAQESGRRVEDLSRRNETGQVFANADGSWTSVQSSSPVRAMQDNGQWAPIDLDLERVPGGYAPVNALGNLLLSDGETNAFAQMTIQDREVSWKWPGTLPTPIVEGFTLTYPEVVEGGDLVVAATPTGFRHDLVLRHAPANDLSIAIPVVTSGPSVRQAGDGGLRLETRGGEELVTAPEPVMYDAANDGFDAASRVLPVDTTVTQTEQGSVIRLEPDPEFLNDDATRYPVVIDPAWSATNPDDTWINNTKKDAIHPYDETLYAGTPDGGVTRYRSFIRFNNNAEPWQGGVVSSATLTMRNFHSSGTTCTGNAVEVRRVAGVWTPGTLTWNNQPSTVAGSAATSSARKGGDTGCAAGEVTWNVTDIAKEWAGPAINHGLRVAGYDETKTGTYRKYRAASTANEPQLSVTYNHYPNTPGKPTISPASSGITTSLTPKLSATVTDPDGGSVKATFTVTNASTGSAVWSGTSATVANKGTASVTVPAGKLADGATYSVKATANDGSLSSKAGSVATTFTVQLPAPSSDPVIQEILSLSDPGTTEGEVLALVDEMVAGSAEDGESQPITVDVAKQQLLEILQESSPEPTTDEEPPPPAGVPCEWSVQSDGADLWVGHAGLVEPLTRTGTEAGDTSTEVYAGEVSGDAVSVTVWQGSSESELAASIAASEEDLDSLGDKSVNEALDGEHEEEVSQQFSDLPMPSAVETVAYRLEVGDSVEHGVPTQDAAVAELADIATDASRECVRRDAVDASDVELKTDLGQFIIESPAADSDATVMTAAATTYPRSTSVVRYRTFIPPASVNALGPVCGTFRGDDRGFSSYYSRSNRTRASVFFNWPSRTIDTTKHVGATHRLEAYGRSAATKTASSAGIKFHTASIAPTFGRIAVTHSVGNPLCAFGGSIKYNIVIEAWKSGAARISGTRVKVPAHEAYLYPTSGEYGKTIMKKSASKFICLSLNCGQQTLWETVD